jgi:hypothetical protein
MERSFAVAPEQSHRASTGHLETERHLHRVHWTYRCARIKMQLEIRVEQVGEEHIQPYQSLSQIEYGEEAAVSQAQHLRWKFIENPQGPSVGIHLYRGGELVARMVALAKQFVYRGNLFKAAHIVDFLVHPEVRGMQSLLQLVRGLRQLSGFDFLLVLAPNPAGAAVWEKFVKMRGYFDLDVAVAALRPATLLQSAGKLRTGVLAPVLDWPWRCLLTAAAHLAGSPAHLQIDTQWPEQAEVDSMFADGWGDRIAGVRSAEFIEWRYRRSPVFRYNIFFLRVKGELSGYFVTRRTIYDGIDCQFVVDAFGSPQLTAASWRAAARKGISIAASDGATMSMILGNTSWGPLSALSRFPFLTVPPRYLPRKTAVYAEWISNPGFDIRRDNFYVALGDSDVV